MFELRRLMCLVCLVATCGGAHAFAEESRIRVPEADDLAARDAIIERTLDAIDVVLEHHIDPPTRQEIVHALVGQLDQLAHSQVGGLRRLLLNTHPPRVSAPAHTRDEAARCLSEAWDTLSRRLIEAAPDEQQSAADEPAEKDAGSADPPHVPSAMPKPSMDDLFRLALYAAVPGGLQFLPPGEARVREQLQANRYVGIGIATGLDQATRLPRMHLVPSGPAEKAGARTGDLVVSVDGQPMEGVDVRKFVELVRGEAGTQVTLVVREPGDEQTRTLTITRGLVPRETVRGLAQDGGWHFRVDPTRAIAYLQIGEIGGSTVHELRQIEQRLQNEGIEALVLDFRSVSQGAPHYAALLADALLDGGPIGRVRTKSGVREYSADRECLFRGWPLAVLVDESTADMAEWVAAALQDNGRAIVVGRPTSGRAYAYGAVPFPGRDEMLELATGLLERPSSNGQPPERKADAPSPPIDAPRPPAFLPSATPVRLTWNVRPEYMVEIPRRRPFDPAALQRQPLVEACHRLQARLDAERR